MGKKKIGRIGVILVGLVMAVTLMASTACTPADAEMLKGVLQNVNSANGTVTVVTQDGKTVTLNFDGTTLIATQGGNSTVMSLEPGASLQVKVKKGELVARQIDARQAEASGNITSIVSGNITILTKNNKQVTIQVTDSTRIRVQDSQNGTLADLQVGTDVKAVYDPITHAALRVTVENEENEDAENENDESDNGQGEHNGQINQKNDRFNSGNTTANNNGRYNSGNETKENNGRFNSGNTTGSAKPDNSGLPGNNSGNNKGKKD